MKSGVCDDAREMAQSKGQLCISDNVNSTARIIILYDVNRYRSLKFKCELSKWKYKLSSST